MLDYKTTESLINLANKLDSLGFTKEAEAVEQILLKKDAGIKDELIKGLKGSALGLALLTQPSHNPELPISEPTLEIPADLIPTPKATLDDADFFSEKIKSGDNITKIIQRAYPKVNTAVMTAILKEIYPDLDLSKLQAGKELKLPKLDSLPKMGFDLEFGIGFEDSESVKDYSKKLYDYMMKREEPKKDSDGTFNGRVYDTGVGQDDLTIGYGHKLTESEKRKYKAGETFEIYGIKVNPKKEITKEQAIQILKKDLEKAANTVDSYNFQGLNQNQFDALVSIVFNMGSLPRDIRTLIIGNKMEEIPDTLSGFGGAGGESVQGLHNRRNEEIEMFRDAVYLPK